MWIRGVDSGVVDVYVPACLAQPLLKQHERDSQCLETGQVRQPHTDFCGSAEEDVLVGKSQRRSVHNTREIEDRNVGVVGAGYGVPISSLVLSNVRSTL